RAPPLARALGKLPAGDDRARGAGRGARRRPARRPGAGGMAGLPTRRRILAAAAGVRAQPPGRGDPGPAGHAAGGPACRGRSPRVDALNTKPPARWPSRPWCMSTRVTLMKSTLMMGTLMKSTLMKSAPMKGTSMDTPPTAISRPLPRLALAALVLALGACATQSGDAVAPQAAPAEAGDAATSPGVPDAGDVAMHCHATAAQPFVGRHATP